ncbi:RND efflux system, outer membrane lipoprotein CmeC [plant metagenome]|uniref:RND efflux system, outer membrane lipoprotein CmeC n=1 Tax=plant metagenome TaxID=1297885 RepID=A0A484TWL2_9ZZZZ
MTFSFLPLSRAPRRALPLAALALAGCGLMRGDYTPPAVTVPVQWQQAQPAQQGPVTQDPWWTLFQEPALDELVNQALARNNDLAAAAIRVRRAQLQQGLAEDALFPDLGGNANVGRDRALRGDRAITRSNSVGLTVSYELDLWNRLGSQRDAARWQALATEEDRASAALTLSATTVNLYWQLAHINERLVTSQQSIDTARITLRLVQAQFDAGAVSPLDLAEARRNVAAQEASHTQLVQQRVEYLNALAILFDGPPGQAFADPRVLPTGEPPAVRAGVPAEVLARRPDLRAAELRLRGLLATVDATRASYYPPLTLTGALGSASTALANVLQNPVASLGAGLTLPFLRWNEMRLNTRVSEADFDEAVVNFRQSLYQSLADVENALSAREQSTRQNAWLAQALADAREAERLYEIRYRAGAVALRVWLEAQEQRRTAEIALADNRLQRLLNQVTLYQALGGSDQPVTAEGATPPAAP